MSPARSEESRAKIRQAATDLFVEQGYPNTSMDGIARRAKVARATIYNNFGDKSEILSSIITEYLEGYVDLSDRLRDVNDGAPKSSFDLIRSFIREALAWRAQNSRLRPLLEQAKHLREAEWERANTYADAAMVDWLLSVHRRDAEAGRIRDDVDLVFATVTLYSMVEASFSVADARSEEAMDRASLGLTLLYWRALYKIPVPRGARRAAAKLY